MRKLRPQIHTSSDSTYCNSYADQVWEEIGQALKSYSLLPEKKMVS